jgi:ABC-2 type transport system permease protein
MSAATMTTSRWRQPAHRIAALARVEGVLLRRNRLALLNALVLPVLLVFALKAAPSVGDAGGSRGAGAILLTALVAFALLSAVYCNLVTALVARREQLVLKRLRTGESTDPEILAGTPRPPSRSRGPRSRWPQSPRWPCSAWPRPSMPSSRWPR